MSDWRPEDYLRFATERTRPAHDLAARVPVASPAVVVDLGCGPGTSTAVLRTRWPDARVIGLDSSPGMIATARERVPDGEWEVADIAAWRPPVAIDVLFSNAALQWVPDHGALMSRLMGMVAPGGALAFQIPSAEFAAVRRIIHEVASEEPWAAAMAGPLAALTMEHPAFYHDALAPLAASVDIWETEYWHVLGSHDAVVDWIASTGMRPFLDAAGEGADAFRRRVGERVPDAYPMRPGGAVLFPFRRTFVVATAAPAFP